MKTRKAIAEYRITTRDCQVEPPQPPGPPPPDDAIQRMQYSIDQMRAENSRLTTLLDGARRNAMTDEQRTRLEQLENQQRENQEALLRRNGEFDALRQQLVERHNSALEAERTATRTAREEATAREQELNQTLIGLAFSNASDWFGPTGKTVLLPAVAQAYFAGNVAVETVAGPNNTSRREVVVKDSHGATIVDPKTGRPMPFAQAIGELIEAHPHKDQMIRGSGRAGSGSAGGTGGRDDVNLSRLRPADFNDPNVRDQVRDALQAPGGLKIGPAFDRIDRQKRQRG